MSSTLGEKLRQAREEKGFTISEVAEQTRISSLYLQSIENDDYNTLPGGIFNKGFVKSFAKFVGIDEQEALEDYGRLISQSAGPEPDEVKVFRPEVLTDDRPGASMAPTIIIAAIILALMTVGVLFLVDYIRRPAGDVAADTPAANANMSTEAAAPSATPEADSAIPQMESLKIEFTALSEPVALLVTTDGKTNSATVSPGTSVLLEPKESLKLSYSRSLANVVQLTINGKKVTLPVQPFNPRRNAIDFEINKQNLASIWEAGTISQETIAGAKPTDVNAAANSTAILPPAARPVSTPRTQLPPANTNSRPAANAPAATPPTPPANTSGSPGEGTSQL